MNAIEAKKYLSEKYPNSDIFEGVIKGGLYDVVVSQSFNPNAGEFDDEFIDNEVVIINM